MKKKITAALGIVVVAALMVFLPPPEWAGAQGPKGNSHQPTALGLCIQELASGHLSSFGACIANYAKAGEF